jgi:regulation of enolase protein 1 (concanavalin A-like superfamily)
LVNRLIQGGALAAALVVCAVAMRATGLRAQSTTLPSDWFSQDIGNPSVAGSASAESGTFTVTGSGTDIGEAHDEFRFVYLPVSGDVDVRVLVDSFTFADWTAKAGVMIRERLTGDSATAYAFRFPDGGVSLRSRTATGAGMSGTNPLPVPSGSSRVEPVWLRLVRTANTFTAYRSYDGVSWTTFGSQTITMSADAYVGLAVTSYDGLASATATFSSVHVVSSGSATADPVPSASEPSTSEPSASEPLTSEPSTSEPLVSALASLPAPWRNRDINGTSLAGAASYASGTFTVKGAGVFGGTSERFHFVYRAVTGDFEIIARVASLQQTTVKAKAGVLFRGKLDSGARQHAFMFSSASNTWRFQRRIVRSGPIYNTLGPGGASPGWVRLVREGDLFTGYHSANGTTWRLVDSDTLPYMPATLYVGLAVASGTNSATATARFTNVVVRPYDLATNQAPTVSLSSPSAGATYTAPATITLNAAASDSDGTISRVDFYRGSTLIGSDASSPYSYAWSGVPAGSYQLTAVARDNDGATRTSAAIGVTVKSGTNHPPSVAISSPASGSTFKAPATIGIQATASDTDGSVTRVDFYRGSTLIGSDTSSPYSATWTSAPAGSYTLTAIARDDDGATRTSAGVNITVSTTSNSPPTVSITSPASGATFAAPASLTINATAADSNGTITRVDFYGGSQLIGTDTASPFSATWTGVGAGSYALTAVARDNAGATRTSNAVSITVTGTSVTPTTLVFVPSTNHATAVTSYRVALRRASDPVTATTVATRDLGKPAIVNNLISVNISTLVDPLPAGSYYAVVSAIGSGGTSTSAPSPTFTK